MASTFALTGTYQAVPPLNMPSGDPLITAPIDERQSLTLETAGQLLLSVDGATALPFGGLSSASVVCVKVTGGNCKLRLTSAAGTAQVVPVDSFAVLMSGAEPFTAATVERPAGVNVFVKYFLGQRAS